MKRCTKLIFIVVLVGFIAIFSTGCQDKNLENCREENLKLQKTIEEQQKQLEMLNNYNDALTKSVFEMSKESDKVEKQLAETERELEKLKKVRELKKMSPEKKAKMIEGIEELKKARQIKAERMKKQQQEN